MLRRTSPSNVMCDVRSYFYQRTLAVYLTESKPEFYMNSSVVSSNLQHGLFLENVRNYVVVNASSVTYNGYGAGIRIYSGAGTTSFFTGLQGRGSGEGGSTPWTKVLPTFRKSMKVHQLQPPVTFPVPNSLCLAEYGSIIQLSLSFPQLYCMHMHGCVVQIGEMWLWYMSEDADLCAFVSCQFLQIPVHVPRLALHRVGEVKIPTPLFQLKFDKYRPVFSS